ncbi:MAG: hypothetical protein Q8P55_02985, partial [bacterium]|nr:hypothetical protein [bacterium]
NHKILKTIQGRIEYIKVNSASAKPVKTLRRLDQNLAKIVGAFMADGSLSVQIIIATNEKGGTKDIGALLKEQNILYSQGYSKTRKQYYCAVQAKRKTFGQFTKVLPRIKALPQVTTQTHYSIELTEEYKDNVEAFAHWMKEAFNVTPHLFEQRGHAWRIAFSNKIVARYLICFLDVWPGPKTQDAFEPQIIKNSSLNIRKAFARGVLMFDGCVTKDSKILLDLKSSSLISSIGDIWKKDDLTFGKRRYTRKNNYTGKPYTGTVLYTTANNNPRKLINYFENGTQKWKLLHWLSGSKKHVPQLRISPSSISFERILSLLKNIERCDIEFLQNYFMCSRQTIVTYLNVLHQQKKLLLSQYPKQLSNHVNEQTGVSLNPIQHKLLFSQAKSYFKYDLTGAKFIGAKKATYSAWKTRKNRIPLQSLKVLCSTLRLDVWKITKKPTSLDRKLVEFKELGTQDS